MAESISNKITLLNQTTLEALEQGGDIDVIKGFTEAGLKIMEADFGFAWWKLPGDENYQLAYKSPNTPYEPNLPRERGGNYEAQKNRKPVFVSSVKSENYEPEYDISGYMGSYVIVPISYNNDLYGNLIICFKKQHNFSSEDKILCEALGNSAAQAITILRLVKSEQQARLEAESQQARFQALIENSYDTIALIDAEGIILDVSRSVTRMSGYEAKNLLGHKIHDILHSEDLPILQGYILEALQKPDMPRTLEVRYRHNNGSWHWLEATGLNMLENPDVRGIVVNIRDVTERKQTQDAIEHQALHDALTGLPNRQEFAARFDQALENAKRNKNEMALMFLDIDRFKNYNDRLGHSLGDTLLKVVASRFVACLRSEDVVARFGGDEFLILISEINSPKDAVMVAEKILKAVRLPVKIGDHTLHPTVSIGIAIYPADGQTREILRKNADIALYRSKASGRNCSSLYDHSVDSLEEAEKFVLENEFRTALEIGQIEVYYQPIIDLSKHRLNAVEALVRWQHPTRGLLAPAEFIPLAEEAGLLKEMDEYVLKKACRQSKLWEQAGLPSFYVTVNMSASWFSETGFPAVVSNILKEYGSNKVNLELEITESIAMSNLELTSHNLKELKKLGVRIAIDDFGTGYSSLSYLKRFPINSLKIDKSFIRHCITDPQDTSITKTIIAMAHTLNLNVIAEGVETEQQVNFLKSLGCNAAQGFYISKPLPPSELELWMEENNFKKKVAVQ